VNSESQSVALVGSPTCGKSVTCRASERQSRETGNRNTGNRNTIGSSSPSPRHTFTPYFA